MTSRIIQDHPFLPLRVGTRWEYETGQTSLEQAKSLPATRSLEEVVAIQREPGRLLATLMIHHDYHQTSTGHPNYVSLLPDGLMFGNGPQSGTAFVLRVMVSEGVYLPRDLPLGRHWSYRVELGNEQQTQELVGELSVIGFEEMEVPAGRYNVVQIDHTLRNRVRVKPAPGLPALPPIEHTQHERLYYARGVGLVRAMTKAATGYTAIKTLMRFSGK